MNDGKEANQADWLEAFLHREFTVQADMLFGDGMITREERIALSGAIGDALDVFHQKLQEPPFDELRRRQPFSQAGDQPLKAGRRNSAADLASIQAVHDVMVGLGAVCGEVAPKPTVKALGQQRIGGYAVLWGDATRKDLAGEYFTRETEELDAIFQRMKALPSLYHHGGDGVVKAEVIGQVDVMVPDDVGLWFEAQLLQAARYRGAIDELISRGALGVSTGTLPIARKSAPDGRIVRWPIVEISLTPTPAEFRMMERPVSEIKAAYTAIGLHFPGEPSDDAMHLELERLALLTI